MSWDFLKSRAFWSAVGPLVAAVCSLLGLTDEETTAILTIVTAIAGFFGVTLARARLGMPLSYKRLAEQAGELEVKNRLLKQERLTR